jgi:polysaccharide export outer membrane protein
MNVKRLERNAAWLAVTLAIGGCAMPHAVSSYSDVQHASEAGEIDLVPVTAGTLPAPPPKADSGFPAEFLGQSAFAYDHLGPGDRLDIKVIESGTPTVFTNNGGDLGELRVDEAGMLYLPYAGALKVSGMTLPEARAEIFRKLRTVVLNPQVDIRMLENRSKLVSVQGAAAKTGSFLIERGRTRLGELLAEAAPDQKNPEMLEVTVRRGDATGTARLSDIYSKPALDIALRPGDSVIVREVVENVTVLGATGVQGQVRVPKREFNVLDAIGEARGLSEDYADPRAVYVLRAKAEQGAKPLVYQFDLRQPSSIELARRFVLRDQDAIMVSSAPFAQTRKVISSFASGLTAMRSGLLAIP